MSFAVKISEHTIYKNPIPQLRSRQAKFPGLSLLNSGELIAMFELGEAFESVDSQMYIARSGNNSCSWQLQGPLYDKSKYHDHFSKTLKPTTLFDQSLIAIGYQFDRSDPELPIGNSLTGGLLPGQCITCFSNDNGQTWTPPTTIDTGYPEMLEISGPCIKTTSGELLAVGCPMVMWDGSNPTGQVGILLRSKDMGKTWNCKTPYFSHPKKRTAAWEARICEMQPGRLVVIMWNFDLETNTHLANHVAVSHDNGHTWSDPINTGHVGQASNIIYAGADKLISIHAHRAGEVGLFIRLIDFKNDAWKMEDQMCIWGNTSKQDTSKTIVDQFASLKFGQPSLLQLPNGELLATHWCVEDGIYIVKTHRLKLNF